MANSETAKSLAGAVAGEAWDQVKATADTIWDELKTGIAAAQSKVK